jgi:2-polyprenyl-3-methyl-5-hydroxy-6-metoxy-1,4-benzoquinol methylase
MNTQHDKQLIHLPISFQEIVSEIVQYTGLPRPEVEDRVWMQALEPGWNVIQDANRFGVTQFQFDEKMIRLYTEGDGFIFDSLVFWSKPSRRLWIEHALDRIQLYAEQRSIPLENLKILMHGDGPGNDSLFLANSGLHVDYYDVPGSKTFNFAVKRFQKSGLWERNIHPINDYQECLHGQYDVVLSFEVLEHLPKPLVAIQDIHSALKAGGIAIITEDFGDLAGYLPTHLRSSAKYFGAAPFLFLRNHMVLSWYSRQALFKPFEFIKVEKVTVQSWIKLALNYHVRSFYLSKYFNQVAQRIKKLPYFRLNQHE